MQIADTRNAFEKRKGLMESEKETKKTVKKSGEIDSEQSKLNDEDAAAVAGGIPLFDLREEDLKGEKK